MDKENIFKSLTIRMIAEPETCHVLDGNFLIADTDDESDSISELSSNPHNKLFFSEPFKVEFALCVLIKSGSMQIMHNLMEYTISPGDVFVVMPGDFARCLSVSSDCRLALLAFSDSYYAPMSNGSQYSTLYSFFRKHPKNSIDDQNFTDILYILDIMKRRVETSDKIDKKNVVRGYIYALCQDALWWTNAIKDDESGPSSRGEEILAAFLELLEENFTTEHRISFYADKLCISAKHLSETVKSVSGRGVKEWIQEYLLLEAKALLQSRRYSIQEISWKLNFANQSFFGTWFKKAAGMSPRQYCDYFSV